MSYTMEDFQRQYAKDHFARLTPEEQRQALELLSPERRREVLKSLPVEDLLAALSTEQIQHLQQQAANRPAEPRKPRRKK